MSLTDVDLPVPGHVKATQPTIMPKPGTLISLKF